MKNSTYFLGKKTENRKQKIENWKSLFFGFILIFEKNYSSLPKKEMFFSCFQPNQNRYYGACPRSEHIIIVIVHWTFTQGKDLSKKENHWWLDDDSTLAMTKDMKSKRLRGGQSQKQNEDLVHKKIEPCIHS